MKNKIIAVTFMLSLSIAISSASATETVYQISGIKLGDTYKAVETLLGKRCKGLVTENVISISFPLAKEKEQHIVCRKLIAGGKVAVTFADGKASHIYSENIPEKDINKPSSPVTNYLGYDVFDNNLLWIHKQDHSATLISPEGLHPHLFVWKNPRLADTTLSPQPVQLKEGYPPILQFGSSLEALMPLFEATCNPLQIRETKTWLPNSPKKQIQVDCFNYHYLGFPRKVEVVFGDDTLELAWILIAANEEERVVSQLIGLFGQADNTNGKWESFSDGKIYLRMDKPEVLAISTKLVPFYKKRNEK